MATPDNNIRTALLLSGQSYHFSNTHARMIKELSADFGRIDILSATWSDRFDTIDTRFNNDVEYLRSRIIPEQNHSQFVQLNSTSNVLVSNNELLDEFKRMQRNFDVTLNVMQFIKYFAGPLLVSKSFRLFREYAHEHNITYDHVCRSRFDILMQDSVYGLVKEEFSKNEFKKIHTKHVAETHADQDTYFGSHKTFEYLSKTYLKEHKNSLENLIRDNFLDDVGKRNKKSKKIGIFPESLFLTVMNNIGITVEERYPYTYTGIYRGDLDKFSNVKDIRRRNQSEINT